MTKFASGRKLGFKSPMGQMDPSRKRLWVYCQGQGMRVSCRQGGHLVRKKYNSVMVGGGVGSALEKSPARTLCSSVSILIPDIEEVPVTWLFLQNFIPFPVRTPNPGDPGHWKTNSQEWGKSNGKTRWC